MFKPLSLFIGLRYTAAKRKNNFISFISFVSIGGIALGVMTMIVVLSVMNGFQKEIAERSISMAFHNTIFSTRGSFDDWRPLMEQAKESPNVIGAAPFTSGQGLANFGGAMAPVQVIGVDPEYEDEVSPLSDLIATSHGEVGLEKAHFDLLKDREFGVLLGTDLAVRLNAQVGDYISLVTSDVNVTVTGVTPRVKRLKVVGVFQLGMYEYDSQNMIVHINDANRLFRIPQGSVEGIRLKLEDPMIARETAIGMYHYLNNRSDISMHTWINEFETLFKMIEIEKLTMFIIMSLIVAVAVFNVVSMLVMVVTEKRSEIAILRTLGMSPANIMMIFMVQGVFIGFFGAVIGIGLGILIASNVNGIVKWLEHLLGKTLFEPSVYPVSEIPSQILMSDVLTVAGIAFILASIATLYPAWKAARTQPAEALRYE